MCSSKSSSTSQNENQKQKVEKAEPTIWTESVLSQHENTFYNNFDHLSYILDNHVDGYKKSTNSLSATNASLEYELYKNTSSHEQCVDLNSSHSPSTLQKNCLTQASPCTSYECGAHTEINFQITPSSSPYCFMQSSRQISQQQLYQPCQKSSSDLFTTTDTGLRNQQQTIVYQQQEPQSQHINGIVSISNEPSVIPYFASSQCMRISPAVPLPASYCNQISSNTHGRVSMLSAPCRSNQPWTYAYCYGYAENNQPCQYSQFVDIEDFMNNEKRKEKSRYAARDRRSRETEIFTELAEVLPLNKEDVNQLDKASIMRIAIAYLKVDKMLDLFPKIQRRHENNPNNDDLENDKSIDKSTKADTDNAFDLLKWSDAYEVMKQLLDGFLLILSNDGDITYVSESITEYLGLAKIDILGQQIWEYSHQCDHAELKEALNIKRNGMADKVKDEQTLEEGLSTDHRDLFVRFKCTLTSRGRSINIKSASYKVIHLTGHLIVNTEGERVLIAVGRPIPHPVNIEIPLSTTTFMTKHSLDMKFTYVDDKMLKLLDYKSEDLLQKSLFICHHGADTDSLMTTFKTVLSKGQGETCRYRFLGKYGGYCWIVTQATVVYDKLKPQSVICVNYVISNLEKDHEIYSLEQYEASQARVKIEEIITNNNNNKNSENNNNTNTNDNYTNNTNIKNNNKIKEIKCNDIEKPISTSEPLQDIKTFSTERHSTSNNSNNNKITLPIPTKTTNIGNYINSTNTANTATSATVATSKTNIKRVNLQSPTPPLATTTTIVPPITTVTHKFLTTPNKTFSSSLPRPKSVTASVFRTAPGILPNIITKNNNNSKNKNNNNSNSTDINSISKTLIDVNQKPDIKSFSSCYSNPKQLPKNVSTRAQSVTSSVLMPISQINKPKPSRQEHQSNNSFETTTSIPASLVANTQQQDQDQDMNKGFLTFAGDATNGLTMLKEEPDDLAHLAPSASTVVDACMPLDETTPLFSEMLVGLMGSYESLLPDDINSLDSTSSSATEATKASTANATLSPIETKKANRDCTVKQDGNNNSNYNSNDVNGTTKTSTSVTATLLNNKNNAHVDPFINYREESNDTNCSQHLLSPSVTCTSPEVSSLPSLCSPNSLSQEDEFAFMTMNVDDDIDLTTRAPYIPMNEQDDLPLLTADDLMWCSNNAFSTEEMQLQKDIVDAMEQQLQQLQQIQAACDNAHLRGNVVDFMNTSQQNQQHQLPSQHLNNNFPNSLCSSPASTISSMSPSPVNNLQHNSQQQQQQDTNNTTAVFSSDSSELAALLCGSGNGALTILGNTCDDNCGGIGGGVLSDSSSRNGVVNSNQQVNNCTPNNVGGSGGSNDNADGINFCEQILLQQTEEHVRPQQQQQLIGGLNIICKKEKFDANASLTTNLCDSIEDAFDNVYSKDSTNLDWNEFLPINVNDTTTTVATATTADAAAQRQLDLQPQELLLNAVPLITIQNNKNLMLQQQTQERVIISNKNTINNNSNLNKLIVNDEMLSTAVTATTYNNPNGKTATIKLLNAPATLRVVDAKLQQSPQQTMSRNQRITKTTIMQTVAPAPQQYQQHGNKRHLNPNTIQFETKRLKSGTATATAIDLQQATPQLLQQLIAPMAQKQEYHQQQQQQQQMLLADVKLEQHQQSKDMDTTKQDPTYLDESSLDNSSPTSPFNNASNSSNEPIRRLTSTASVLRNYRHNPMIGGSGILPSPVFLHNEENNEDNPSSSPPDLITAYDVIDSGSDSGIDDTNSMDTNNIVDIPNDDGVHIKMPLKVQLNDNILEKQNQNQNGTENGLLLMKCCTNDNKNSANQQNDNSIKRKTSISFMDSSNPLLTPFLMDLCNDDYNMNTGEFSEENDIESVLNQWSPELV